MAKTIVIVGVGALGSHTVQFLRNVDAKIRIVDFDRVEQKNTQSQFHGKSAIGKPKVQAVGQLMQFLFGLKIDTIPHKLVDDNVNQLLGNSDLIIDCLDNAKARLLVQGFARKNKVECLHGALAANGDFGRVVWDNSFIIDTEPSTGVATCEDGEQLPFIGLVSSILAESAKTYLNSGKKSNYSIHPGGVIKI